MKIFYVFPIKKAHFYSLYYKLFCFQTNSHADMATTDIPSCFMSFLFRFYVKILKIANGIGFDIYLSNLKTTLKK